MQPIQFLIQQIYYHITMLKIGNFDIYTYDNTNNSSTTSIQSSKVFNNIILQVFNLKNITNVDEAMKNNTITSYPYFEIESCISYKGLNRNKL